MSYPQNSWSILPATQCLLGKTKATLRECMLEMGRYGGKGTILVCMRDNGNGKTTPVYLSSAGRMDYKPGFQHKAHHDQTLRNLGYHQVLACLFYEIVDGEVVLEGERSSAVTLDTKAPLFVFK